MDEFTSIAIWLLIAILTINTTILWINANSSVMSLGGIDNTLFNSSQGDKNSLESCMTEASANYFNPSTPATSKDMGPKLQCTYSFSINTIIGEAGGLQILFYELFKDVPGGSLLIWILIPFISIVEGIAMFVIGLRVALVARGIFQV